MENIGSKASRTVPQLYLKFPDEAQQPVAILKGFQKTAILQPQDSVELMFPLTERDLSFWNEGWQRVNSATAYLADSSSTFIGSVLIELPDVTTTPLSGSNAWKAILLLPLIVAHIL